MTARILFIFNLIHRAFSGTYFGFVKGHSYLSSNQIRNIKNVLNLGNGGDIVQKYEDDFSFLIGEGKGLSFASGRMAFFSLMKTLGIGKDDEVILLGSTCSVMVNAIWRIGALPVFSDIDSETFGSSAIAIKEKITSKTKMVVAQHSFGIPCRIDEIVKLCDEKGIFLLEDSALTFDSSFDNVKVGNWGNAALFSTDHSKPINTLIGGFLYTNDLSLYRNLRERIENYPTLEKSHQKLVYKQLIIERIFYNPILYGASGIFHLIRKILNPTIKQTFLHGDYDKNSSNKIGQYPYPATLPPFLAQLGLYELERWNIEKSNRKLLLNKYLCESELLKINTFIPNVYFDKRFDIIPLRFVYTHPSSHEILNRMSKKINIKWTWFQKPIVTCEDPQKLGYEYGSCILSEQMGENIINWPCVVDPKYHNKLKSLFNNVMNKLEV